MNTHCHDILFSVWSEPVEVESVFLGLVIVTQTYQEGFYFHSCQLIDSWVRSCELRSSLWLREMARGPSGCFDPLRESHSTHFDAVSFVAAPQRDMPESRPPLFPTEKFKMVDSHGTFISPQYLTQWLERLTPSQE